MNVKSIKSSVIAVMSAAAGVIVSTTAFAVERPELRAYPYKTSVTEGGTYANGGTVGTDFVVSGTISSALTFSSDVPYRVTLDGAAVSQSVTLSGDALIDASRFLVRVPGEPDQTLTVRELGLLKTFAAHPGQVLSRDALLDAVWGEDYFAASRTLDQHILQIRRKLGSSGARIETIRGAGYRLRD